MARFFSLIFGCLVLTFILFWQSLFWFDFTNYDQPMQFGVTFSPLQTEHLGLDTRKVYEAMFGDLGVKLVRLGAYWNRIEKTQGDYDFAELDYYLDEAARRAAKVILVVGQRIPRWPECHNPLWTKSLERGEIQDRIDILLTKIVERYKNHPALEMWQVDNEPFLFIFGKCGKMSRSEFLDKVNLVKKLDPNHPTVTSDSGELSTWLRTAHATDYFGSTVYRVAWSPLVGYINHEPSIPAAQYRLKSWLIRKPADRVFLVEVQAEPWTRDGIPTASLDEQFLTMDFSRFNRTVKFVQKTGFPRGYLWGVEWWYWLREQGNPEFWNYASELF